MAFASFMATPAGRLLRVLLGFALMFVGLGMIGGLAGEVLASFALVPIGMGVFNVCPIGPIFGWPLRGKDVLLRTTRRTAGSCCGRD